MIEGIPFHILIILNKGPFAKCTIGKGSNLAYACRMWKMLILIGIALIILGFLSLVLPIGKMPGDLSFTRGNTRVYFPLATSIILSVLLTLVLNFVLRK
jgi:hypothetical protein